MLAAQLRTVELFTLSFVTLRLRVRRRALGGTKASSLAGSSEDMEVGSTRERSTSTVES